MRLKLKKQSGAATNDIQELKKKLAATTLENESLKMANFDESMEKTLNEPQNVDTLEYKNLKDKYETDIMNKDKSITLLRKDKSNLEDVINGIKTQYKVVSKERNELRRNKLVNRNNDEEVIKTKSKARSKKVEDLPCTNPECNNLNEEALIKCNACGKWICEACSDIARLE